MSQDKNIGNGQREHNASEIELSVNLSKELEKRAARLSDQTIDIAIRAKEARDFLDWHTSHCKTAWIDWIEHSNAVIEDIRQARVAISTESKQLLASCADVRKFFVGPDHDKEIAKLREFIELAERLRALKNDGTLDKLADTILKLS